MPTSLKAWKREKNFGFKYIISKIKIIHHMFLKGVTISDIIQITKESKILKIEVNCIFFIK
jgi:hypothetical protein